MTETAAEVPPEQRDTTEPTERTNSEDEPAVYVATLEMIWVESNLGTDEVAFFEKDASHPDGEVFVGPGPAVQAAQTAGVLQAIANGRIKEGSEPAAEPAAEKPA